jgi:hypothetical protein
VVTSLKRTVQIARRRAGDPAALSLLSDGSASWPRVMADITRNKNLNPRWRHRTYPRAVKPPKSYRVKRPGNKGTCHDGPPMIVLVNLPGTEVTAT